MANSIYNKNRTYYYKNETSDAIYECKLVSVRLAFHNTKMSELITANGEKEGIYLDQIMIHYYWEEEEEHDEDCDEFYDWTYDHIDIWREGKQKDFEPTRVYSTEENAINEISPLFVRKNGRICLNHEIEFPPTPENTFWKKNSGWFSKKYNLATYDIDGVIQKTKYDSNCIYIAGDTKDDEGYIVSKEKVYYKDKWEGKEYKYKEDIDAINHFLENIIKDKHFHNFKEWVNTEENDWPCFDLIPYKWFINTVWNYDGNSYFATKEEAEIGRNKTNKKNKVVNKGLLANKGLNTKTKTLE